MLVPSSKNVDLSKTIYVWRTHLNNIDAGIEWRYEKKVGLIWPQRIPVEKNTLRANMLLK